MVGETFQAHYALLRDTLASADTDLSSTQKTWAHFVTNYSTDVAGNKNKSWRVAQKANAVVVTFDFATANSDTGTFSLYAYRPEGPAEFVCSGDLTAGAQATDDSRYYADTIASLTQRWLTTVYTVDAGANNGVAKLCFDLCGADRLLCLFTTIGAGSVRAKVTFL